MSKMSPVDYAMHYGSGCRDCADADGICPDRGTPCDPTIFRRVVEHAVTAFTYGIKHGFMENPFMTASNTPTLELVERLLEPWDQRQSRRVQIEAEAAAAIAKLTAERDEWMEQAGRMQVHLTDEYERVEAAEKRVKELETERDAARDAHTTSMGNLSKAHAAVNEWKERVEVLEKQVKELEVLQDSFPVQDTMRP